MSSKKRRIRDRINDYCNVVAIITEIVGITVVSYGNYLEKLYCQDVHAMWISLGALVLLSGAFIQKKLPWAYTRFGMKRRKDNKE